jgi:DNA polymerase-3 subunit chi
MMVEFFNLRAAGLDRDAAIAWLAEKYMEQRVLLLCADEGQMRALDQYLWTYDPLSFLPHAPAGQGEDEEEPILLSNELENRNQAKVLILAYNPAADWLPPPVFLRVVELIPLEPGPCLDACRVRYRELGRSHRLTHTTSLE